MEALIFSQFKREMEDANFKNPKFKFDRWSVKIIALPYFNDIVGQLLVWFGSCLFLFNSALLLVSIFIFICSWYLLYINFIGLNICQIDFSEKIIIVKNRFFLLNLLRGIFGIKTRINLSDIKEVTYKEGALLNRWPRWIGFDTRYNLLLETYSDPPVSISQFKNEKDAVKVAVALKKIILSTEKSLFTSSNSTP